MTALLPPCSHFMRKICAAPGFTAVAWCTFLKMRPSPSRTFATA